ncbi:condensation domain-containing protein [Micromonospora sp. WMMA1923]|uniref:condensation domain-containing protein n=1 Tax=Micromonospora sp. WMMA1923 TaxID=3404125 RepID=UPI003B93C040
MFELTLVDQLVVAFKGERAGRGPLTVGQLNTLQWLGNGSLFTSVEWVLDLPAGTTLDDVTESMAVLLARHESLRTLFHPDGTDDSGEPTQQVVDSGELRVDVYAVDPAGTGTAPAATAPAGTADPADGDGRAESDRLTAITQVLTDRLQEAPFRVDEQLPVRVGVAVRDGRPIIAVIACTHLAADCGSLVRLGEQFARLVRDPASRTVGPRGHQPLDQALRERTPQGRARLTATLGYWRRHLVDLPQCLYAAPVVADDGGGPLSGFLESPAIALALPLVAARTGTSRPMVLLAAYCALVARRTGNRELVFASVVNNRIGAHLHDYVGTLAQDSLVAVDAGTTSFDELIRRAGAASLIANRHGMFRQDELVETQRAAGRARGSFFQRDCAVNIMGLGGGGTVGGDARDAVAAVPHSRLRWWVPPSFRVMLMLRVIEIGGLPVLGLTTDDTLRVPADELATLLRAMEALVVAAAAGDVDLASTDTMAAVTPLRRGPEWLRVGPSWVEWPQAQQLVAEALGAHHGRVFALPAADGGASLVAYAIAGTGLDTPEQAHAACLAAVERHFMTVTPGYYVLCADSPDDSDDLAAWQGRPVVAAGDGRGTPSAQVPDGTR